jgi:hypothetical protein
MAADTRRDGDAESLALKILEAQTGIFEGEVHGRGNILRARFARLAGFRAEAVGWRFTDSNDSGLIANGHGDQLGP